MSYCRPYESGPRQPKSRGGETANLIELMRDENDCASCAGDIAHLAEAFFSGNLCRDGQDFIDEENLRLEVSQRTAKARRTYMPEE